MNAFEIPGCVRFTLNATSACEQYRFIKANSEGGCEYATKASDPIVGVAYTAVEAAQPLSIVNDGIVMVEASAAIEAGAMVSPAANGMAVTDSSTGKFVALTSSTAAGQLISVLL